MSNTWVNGPIEYLDQAAATVTLKMGLGDVTLDPAVELAMTRGAGKIDPTWIGVGQARPVGRFVTSDIKAVIESYFTNNGLAIKGAESASATPFDIYFTKMLETSRAGTLSHMKFSIAKGLLLPEEVSWSEGAEPATITCQVIAIKDGTTDPVTIATNQTLPTISSVVPFFGGIATVEGVDLSDEIIGCTVSWNLSPETLNTGQDQHPVRSAVVTAQKEVRLRTKNVLQLSTFGMRGQAITSPAVIYFAKGDTAAGRVASGTPQHCSLTINAGSIYCGPFSGDEGSTKTGEIVISVADDLTNLPFVWAFNATLP